MEVDFQNSLIFVLLCLLSLLCYSLYVRRPQRFDLPPSPPSLPLIGHFHLILSLLIHKSFQKLSSKHGPLLYLRIFNVPIVLVSSSSVASEIFKTHDLNVSFRGLPPLDESLLFGSSTFLMAPHGDYLKFMKKLLVTNLLGSQALERSRCIRADELERFYANLLGKAINKEMVDIGKEAMKNTTLLVNVYAVMRDPGSWEDPDEFNPERFLASLGTGEEDERREQAHKYIPFGGGRRGCPGANLAYIFIGTAVGMMVQCFDWKIKGGQVKLEEAAGELNLTMAHPLKCTPVARPIKPLGFK
ncbi:hypothetical protein DY000_02049739 [Brassica cretica]|uniref:Cytochrome P450 n=1 Tax=Brassica cretica TaxID=69181 RepID=A0ABQ7F635_BRACR|nr:hypothetical protein DY000_02049739 [Brassica cretica]